MSRAYKISSEVSFQAVEDTVFLLDVAAGEYFSLNRTGSQIWDGLTAGKDLDAILEDLRRTYADRSREELESDLHELVGQLESRRLISPVT